MEVKTPIYKRVAPGDRWCANGEDPNTSHISPTLTHAMEQHFQKTGIKKYYVDAGEGILYALGDAPDPAPPSFSIYGNY